MKFGGRLPSSCPCRTHAITLKERGERDTQDGALSVDLPHIRRALSNKPTAASEDHVKSIDQKIAMGKMKQENNSSEFEVQNWWTSLSFASAALGGCKVAGSSGCTACDYLTL